MKGKWESQGLTCDSGAAAEVDWIPDHGPISNRKQCLRVLVRIAREGRERGARATKNQCLKPW